MIVIEAGLLGRIITGEILISWNQICRIWLNIENDDSIGLNIPD